MIKITMSQTTVKMLPRFRGNIIALFKIILKTGQRRKDNMNPL